MSATTLTILLLAAGASTRMRGGDKLLEEIDGEPVLRRQAKAALAADGPVFVALPPDRPTRQTALQGINVTRLTVPDATEGMGASIRAGVAALPKDGTGVMILPADMPEITADDIQALATAHARQPDAVLRGASEDGVPGHPVVFPARLFDRLRMLTGDAGARAVLQDEAVRLIPLPARHALTDLDTPEDWAAWRAARQG